MDRTSASYPPPLASRCQAACRNGSGWCLLRGAAKSRPQPSTRECGEYWHRAQVASEVARIEPRAEMDFEVVKAIADQERAGRR